MKLKVTVDGKVYEVEVEVAPEPQQVLPTFMMQSAAAALPAGVSGGAVASTNGDEAVDEAKVCRSPISGIVVKSNVRLGQTIEPGDLLFVLEAMKMETEVTASIGGKVAEVKVNAGDSVKSGQVVLVWA
ncbi:MAG TPA: biotin/lipoyl-containing protein [Candidatus Acidoferrum sp.]|jgi:methylmalonyl-CoA carboxyltransferase small subunit